MKLFPLVVLLVGCATQNSGKASTDEYVVDPEVACPTVLTITPEDGDASVYFHGTVEVLFEAADASASVIEVLDAAGVAVPQTVTWSGENLRATVTPELVHGADYTIRVAPYAVTGEACGDPVTSAFTTSLLGAPLEIELSELVGRVYFFTLEGADIVEPAVLEAFDTQLTAPLLFAVMEVSETSIRFEGGAGDAETREQLDGVPTWPFPPADFTEKPYFSTGTDLLSIDYSFDGAGVTVPIENFTLTGTFSADGVRVDETRVTGIVDTRYLGPMLPQEDSESEACDLLNQAGVYCEACADGAEFCLPIIGENITALWVEGTTLTPVE